ncbi:MAG TPA: TetR/AcrR family transcriptional regulator [Steroidobacteraceae bacterium]|nr:TetR/AcrR family transcriptional regulator [Steroidobacteraceae bacterium]
MTGRLGVNRSGLFSSELLRFAMARPREFDPDKVLQQAMQVFWAMGYEQASLDDICAACGISRSTLYSSFGDKRELLRRSLTRYTDEGTARFRALLTDRPIREGLAAILDAFIDSIVAGPGRRGCFIGNCAAELARHDRQALASVAHGMQRTESILHEALDSARARGELAPDADIRALARFFTAAFQGLRLVGKVNSDRRTLEDIAATTLQVLQPYVTVDSRHRGKSCDATSPAT